MFNLAKPPNFDVRYVLCRHYNTNNKHRMNCILSMWGKTIFRFNLFENLNTYSEKSYFILKKRF